MFLNAISLWVLFVTCMVAAKPGREGKDKLTDAQRLRHLLARYPIAIRLFPTKGMRFSGKLLSAVFKDQLDINEPEKGAVCLYWWKTRTSLNVCRVAIIFASFGNDKTGFRGQVHHLSEENCITTSHEREAFEFDAATNAVKHSNRFRALGRAQVKRNFSDLIDLVYDKSEEYFKKNPNYQYLANNCGDYVQEMVELTEPEFGKIEVPLAPGTRLV
ncbi:hypothetical protein K458DRAFT_407204 [Lentithecium fluviatile CBS 122367]|uniref:DUF4105 domain-containing protein n=1 Tax=Lentithecium fluviatile CBS 122367 TaxID=1168545 RepID=A0A6G1IR46_9PLEO|nr:hypothetical protein K458DRAFT_407204 [Lentithecium fluviatile CBS 122367]